MQFLLLFGILLTHTAIISAIPHPIAFPFPREAYEGQDNSDSKDLSTMSDKAKKAVQTFNVQNILGSFHKSAEKEPEDKIIEKTSSSVPVPVVAPMPQVKSEPERVMSKEIPKDTELMEREQFIRQKCIDDRQNLMDQKAARIQAATENLGKEDTTGLVISFKDNEYDPTSHSKLMKQAFIEAIDKTFLPLFAEVQKNCIQALKGLIIDEKTIFDNIVFMAAEKKIDLESSVQQLTKAKSASNVPPLVVTNVDSQNNNVNQNVEKPAQQPVQQNLQSNNNGLAYNNVPQQNYGYSNNIYNVENQPLNGSPYENVDMNNNAIMNGQNFYDQNLAHYQNQGGYQGDYQGGYQDGYQQTEQIQNNQQQNNQQPNNQQQNNQQQTNQQQNIQQQNIQQQNIQQEEQQNQFNSYGNNSGSNFQVQYPSVVNQ